MDRSILLQSYYTKPIQTSSNILFEDDFSSETDNWLNAGGASHSRDTINKQMNVTGTEGVVYYPYELSGDFTFEYKFISKSGGGDSWIETVVFSNGQPMSGYLFYYNAWFKGIETMWTLLYTFSSISPGSIIKIKRVGNTITTYIDNVAIDTLSDSSFSSGYIGFVTQNNGSWIISNLKVYKN